MQEAPYMHKENATRKEYYWHTWARRFWSEFARGDLPGDGRPTSQPTQQHHLGTLRTGPWGLQAPGAGTLLLLF